MKKSFHALIAAILMFAGLTHVGADDLALGQTAPPPQTVQGQLVTIQSEISGEVYVVRDVAGRFVRVRVDKETKKDRLLVTGEKIEVQVLPDGRALSIKPAN